MKDTKRRILAAAERLFARQGFSATSIRAITAQAKVNLAAIHYYFGSKDQLIKELFSRRLAPLNQERLSRLDAYEAESENGAPPLEKILEAFVAPPLLLSRDPARGGGLFMRLLGRAFSEPEEKIRDIVYSQFAEVAHRFTTALGRVLPHLSREELFWRFHFMIGSMAHSMHIMADAKKLGTASRLEVTSDTEMLIRRLIPFLAEGFRTPAPTRPGRKRK